MLEVYGLSKRYGKILAVDNVDLNLSNGQIGILLGPNGAGKSTVIKSIAGLLRYDGEVLIQGLQAKSMEAKRIFAYVPEMPAMFDALTVREHLEYIRRAYGVDIKEEEIVFLLERFDLLDKQNKMGNELSKGMMQKVSICCALIINPQVILLDEPMVGLDPAAIKELKKIIMELKELNVTILISTHMLEMVKDLWDVMYVMEKGKVLAHYKKDEVGDKDIESLFFTVTGGE
ncbi:MAG TPA: ABC transporter ATP-binding protein [Lachnospiraceae bacterium]|nr:ABC transporter ATP-binding protein [Lachnospiraceae bacterium]